MWLPLSADFVGWGVGLVGVLWMGFRVGIRIPETPNGSCWSLVYFRRAALDSPSPQFGGGFNGAPGRIILVSLLRGAALVRCRSTFALHPWRCVLTPLAFVRFSLEWWRGDNLLAMLIRKYPTYYS